MVKSRWIHVACILALLACILLLSRISRTKEGYQNLPDVELVIANYEEDISWVKDIPENLYSKITIYNKGSPKIYTIPRSTVVSLPNIGREGHTYLHHIIQNYDTLAGVTLFLPGSTNTFPQKSAQLEKLIEFLKENQQDSRVIGIRDASYIRDELKYFQIDAYEITNDANRSRNPDTELVPSAIRPFGAWVKAHFPDRELRCLGYRGLALASRKDIQKRPRSFYEKLLSELSVKNPEVGHYVERAWPLILSVPDKNCGGGSFAPGV